MASRKPKRRAASAAPAESASTASPDDGLIDEARKRLKHCVDDEAENRAKRLADLKFATLEQWPPEIRLARESDPNGARPCLTIDKIAQYRTQIINNIRKNRPAVKVRPVDSAGDPKTAQVFAGLIRHIEDASSADIVYETGAESAIDTGVGYFRVVTEYANDMSLDQEIRLKRVSDSFSVYLGPHDMPDGSDAEYGFVVEDVPAAQFKEDWPNAKPVKTDIADLGQMGAYWATADTVRVAEYFYTEKRDEEVIVLRDGQALTRAEYDEYLKTLSPDALPETIIGNRATQVKSIKWCKLTGLEVLDKREWAGKYIPIVKVVGHEKVVDGKREYWGVIRPAIDSQRMYNYWASTITERLALAPKMPFVGAKGQFEGQEHNWQKANTQNFAYLEYNPVDVNGSPLPPPSRTAPAPVEAAMIGQLQLIEHDIQTSLGMFKASVGQEEGDQSGRAIQSLQAQSDTATFHFPANLARSIRHCGKILIDLIPKIYDTAKVVRIIGDDMKPDAVRLDPNQDVARREVRMLDGSVQAIYNLGVGEYDVTVTVGPSYVTARMEQSEAMLQIMQTRPEMMGIIGDLMFRSFDWPQADKIADRLERAVPPQLKEDGEQMAVPPQVQQQMAQMQAGMQQMQQEMQALQQENMKLKIGHEEEMAKIAVKKDVQDKELELERLKVAEKIRLERDVAAATLDLKGMQLEAQGAAEVTGEGAPAPSGSPVAQSVSPNVNGVVNAIANLDATMRMMIHLQQQMLDHMKAPKEIAIGNVQTDASGKVVGASVAQTPKMH